MKKIAFLPIDNRPVCYDLAKMIADVSSDFELILPDKNYLGNLKKSANKNALVACLENLENVDYIILSLDTLTYGGLINSRRSTETFEEIKIELENFKKILKNKNSKILAFSSIMRISNNNINEEEKEYWNRWGKRIFDWSFNYHKSIVTNDSEPLKKQSCICNTIPTEILEDYTNTRKRNFEVNKIYLEWLNEGILDYLVFAKDDCAEFGLNVIEANELLKLIQEKNLSAQVKTGADEIPLSLLARVFSENKNIKIYPKFTQPEFINKISKYEDISVKNSVLSQIELTGAKLAETEDDADFVLFINNFKNEQGELVMNVFEEGFKHELILPDKPFAVADILNANGADNCFVEHLFKNDLSKMIGFAGWNTTGNTLGSLLCMSLAYLTSTDKYEQPFKKLLFLRFLDDWAYQANVRAELKKTNDTPDKNLLKEKMSSFEDILNKKFKTNFKNIKYYYPWDRFFEVGISIDE